MRPVAGPLDGIRVLDFTRYIPGPYCTLLLAQMGADVTTVEAPPLGDPMRLLPPSEDGESPAHTALNRGKRSLVIDLRTDEGVAVLRRLAARADVLIETFRPGVLARHGLGPEPLLAANPRLVYCSLTGYGPDGPLAGRAGHDANYIALGGLLDATRDGEGRPILPGVQLADMTGGLLATIAVLAALQARERTGRGQLVAVSMLDGIRALMTVPAARGTGREAPDELAGGYACYNVYRCRDGGYVSVGALEPKFWAALCAALGLPALAAEQWPRDEARRRQAIDAVAAAFATRDRDDWSRELAGTDACVEPVLGLEEAAQRFGVAALPVRLSETPLSARGRAPRLGEHTDELLRDAGYSVPETERLRAAGVLA